MEDERYKSVDLYPPKRKRNIISASSEDLEEWERLDLSETADTTSPSPERTEVPENEDEEEQARQISCSSLDGLLLGCMDSLRILLVSLFLIFVMLHSPSECLSQHTLHQPISP